MSSNNSNSNQNNSSSNGGKNSNNTSSSNTVDPSNDNHKKRKVWRTVNVSAGGGPPQAMTPEAAAKYIQQATASRGREVKISFGPSRPPNSNSSNNSNNSVSFGSLDLAALKETAAAAAAAGKPNSKGKGKNKNNKNDGLPCSEAEMKALMSMFVEIMGMSMDPDKLKNNNTNNSGKGGKNNKKGPVFMFGNNVPPFADSEAAAGFFADGASWEAIRQTYAAAQEQQENEDDEDDDDEDDDDDDDDDSVPDLSIDDMREELNRRTKMASTMQANASAASSANVEDTKIPPVEWNALEQVAMDDALETEERERKAAKKREKKQRKKSKGNEEKAQKAAEAALKKREKSILSWRSRVVSACQSNEIAKLDSLLQESPLRAKDEEKITRANVTPHLEFLLPNSIAKNRQQLERGKEARHRLATYILTTDVPIAFSSLRTGRTALHTACFHGDVPFVQLVLDKLKAYDDTDSLLPDSYLNVTCDDSGWAPLHYAALSGSTDVLEALLAGGCDLSTITDDTHTWRESDGCGIAPRELVQYIYAGQYEKVLESHGVALQEMEHTFFGNHTERGLFLKTLQRALKRFTDVEANGYSPPDLDNRASSNSTSNMNMAMADSNSDEWDQFQAASAAAAVQADGTTNKDKESTAAARKRKKKKKKKQTQKESSEYNSSTAASVASVQSSLLDNHHNPEKGQEEENNDPLVNALLGMGFMEDQISAAVKACGGTSRATADDLVTWILGNDGDENTNTGGDQNSNSYYDPDAQSQDDQDQQSFQDVNEVNMEVNGNDTSAVKPTVVDDAKLAEEAARQKEEAAMRLAAKREEQRRRNREWNNREQARQEDEAKAKMAHALAAPGYGAPYPASTIPTGLQTGMPNGLHTGVAVASGLKTGLPAAAQQNKPAGHSRPLPVQAAAAPPGASNMNHSVAAAQAATMASNQVTSQLPPSGADFPSLSQAVAAESGKVPPTAVHVGRAYAFPIGDDDRTVSSFGSNPGHSVSSNSFVSSLPPTSAAMSHAAVPPAASAIAPPGFRPPTASAGPPARPPPNQPKFAAPAEQSHSSAFPVELNPLGEIRATAKAFVPSNFTPAAPPVASASTNTNMPPLSSSFSGSSFPPPGSQFHLHHSGAAGGQPPATTSLLGSSLPNPYDRVPSVTPVSDDSVPPPSTASSLTGVVVPRLEEPPLGGISLGFGAAESQSAGNTSSLLSSAFANGPPVGASSIWGGTQSVPSLGGLQPYSFGDGSRDKSGEAPNNMGGQSAGWGAPGGSIW